jgi:hypothetical protein
MLEDLSMQNMDSENLQFNPAMEQLISWLEYKNISSTI